jgi:WD40 repeat protein
MKAVPTVTAGKPIARFARAGLIEAIAWNADGSRIAAVSNKVRLWSVPDGRLLYESPNLGGIRGKNLAFAGDQLVFWAPAAFQHDRTQLLATVDAKDGKPLRTVPSNLDPSLNTLLWSIASDRSGKTVAVLIRPDDQVLRLYDTGDWANYVDLPFPAHDWPERLIYDRLFYDQVRLSADGKRLVASGMRVHHESRNDLHPAGWLVADVWDTGSRQMLRRFDTFGADRNPGAESIALSPNADCAVISAIFFSAQLLPSDVKVRVWDIGTGHQLQGYMGPVGHVQDVAWSPNGRFIAAAAQTYEQPRDGGVFIWDARSAELAGRIQSENHPGTYAVAFSPDGKFIAYGDGDDATLTIVPISYN